ncbi:MAG: DUF433 domain-containing protein [Candidatus Nanohaloarchaea archaeon]
MRVVKDEKHSQGSPTLEGTGIRVIDIAEAYERGDCDPDEITQLYPDLSLSDIHTALAYYYEHIEDFRGSEKHGADSSEPGVEA